MTDTATPQPNTDAGAIAEAVARAVAAVLASTHADHAPTHQTGRTRAQASAENGKQGGRPPAPPHADTADAFARRFDSPAGMTLRNWRGTWRLWRPVEGWREIPETQLLADLAEYMRGENALRKHTTANYMRSVLCNLAASDLCGLPFDLPYPCWLSTRKPANNWISFSDGTAVNILEYVKAGCKPADCMREIDNPEIMRPASCDLFGPDYAPYQFAVDFADHMEWGHTGLWTKHLNRVLPDYMARAALATMFGVCLTDETKWEVFWQLFGKGANGKTVCLDTLTALIGRHNVSTVALSGLVGSFSAWPLTECKVNLTGDMASDVGHGSMAAIEGEFRHAVSGGVSDFQRKNKDLFRAKHRARWVMATNALPTFIDRSDAIWRRLRIIPFGVQIPEAERDPDTAKRIIAGELTHILHWALDGLDEPVNMGQVSDYDEGAALKRQHRLSCDHEQDFLREHYAPRPDDRVKASDVYAAYREWAGNNGYRPLGAARFVQRVQDVFPTVRHGKARFDLETTTAYEGMGQL